MLYLASFPSMFFVMEMVGGGDPDVRAECCLQETVELIHDNTTILVGMLFCCVVVVVSCCLFVVDYQMLWEMVVCTLR